MSKCADSHQPGLSERNSSVAEQFDVAIIGAGQGGGPLASAFANAGKRTILVEREHVGGTCINEGCTPTKTMIASGRVAYLARRASDYGVGTGDVDVDMTVVRQRKRDIVEQWRSGSQRRLDDTEGLTLLMAEARFTGPKTLAITDGAGGTREIEAETIVLNVGERPAPLKVPGAESVAIFNSTTIMELDTMPEHLVIVGGGYVGLEFAQLFRRLGSEVTVVHRGKHLLGREDPDIAQAVKEILEEDGITVHLGTHPEHLQHSEAGIEIKVGNVVTLHATHLLAAAGRIPNSDTLDLHLTGVETDERGQIPTNGRLETNVPGIYAIGDVRPGPKFTHISYDDYRILKANLIDGGSKSIEGRIVPYVVFTDPQLGRVGMSESEAKESGRPYRVATMPMSYVARATETAEPRGVMKAIVDGETERILGAAILGLEGGELMSMVQIAMWGNLPFTTLRDGIFAHPTLSEGFNNLFSSFRE
jgi:pyruvate/2-oxoglutarate dehydrogenase complex dihydrolipoamide dehydrogenase (E3) component